MVNLSRPRSGCQNQDQRCSEKHDSLCESFGKNTTEKDLENHLKKNGIFNCYCKKLSDITKGGREYQTLHS